MIGIKTILKIHLCLIEYFGIIKRRKKPADPLDILIAAILSQNTNDKLSSIAFNNLRNNIKQWADLIKISHAKIERLIKIGGLSKQKSSAIKNIIIELSNKNNLDLKYLKNQNNDEIIRELLKFKGVGIKTAACLLLFGFGRNIIPVDTHIHRILNRTGVIKTGSAVDTFFKLNKNELNIDVYAFHLNLIKLGRLICKAKNPLCNVCPIKLHCKFEKKEVNLKSKIKSENDNFFILESIK